MTIGTAVQHPDEIDYGAIFFDDDYEGNVQ